MDATTLQLCKYLIVYPAQLLAVLTTVALLFRVQLSKRWCWAVTALGLLAFALWPVIDPPCATDFCYFWLVGNDVLAGIDPYRNHFFLNPPTAQPVYALLALLPLVEGFVVWMLSIFIGTSLLVYFSQHALSQETRSTWLLPPEALGVFTVTLALSVASRYGIWLSQAALLTTVLVVLALWAQSRERPILAGILLAIATIKVQTMLPFLLLFCRRKDRATWPTLAITCLALCLLTTPPAELFTRMRECLHNIAAMSAPGNVNNYSSSDCYDMIGFNRALHFLGMTDRTVVQITSLGLIVAFGAWVAWRVLGRKALTGPAAVSLVALYTGVFLYHRLYDMLILALPLVYVAGRAREAAPGRWWYRATALAILGVLYMRINPIIALSHSPDLGPFTRLIEVVVMPHALWLLLLAMAFFAQAERCRAAASESQSRANSAVRRMSAIAPRWHAQSQPSLCDGTRR